MAEQTYTYTNESFSGCDMVATMVVPNPSTGTSKMYTIGEIQTISYSIHQDRRPVRSIGNINAKDYVMGQRTIAGSLVFAVFNKHFAYKIMKDLSEDFNNGYAFLIDEIPPFNIVLSLANEYGLKSKLVIYGIRLINEGQVMSINDIYTENTYQFVATDIEYLNNENEYSKAGKGALSGYVIKDTIRIESDITEPIGEDDGLGEQVNAILKYSIDYKEKIYKNNLIGRYISFWLEPKKETGYLKITSLDNKIIMNISVAENINALGNVVVPLYENTYNIQWLAESEYSNTLTIKVSEDAVIINDIQGPLVEKVSDTSITLCSAVPNHTVLVYGLSTIDVSSVTLPSDKRITINNLLPNKAYYFATLNSSKTETSKFIEAYTAKPGYDAYLEFLEYLRSNISAFKLDDFTVYENCVYETRTLAKTINFKTLSEAFNEKLKRYLKELTLLSPDNFNNIIDYQLKVNELNTTIDVQRNILRILSKYESDKISSLNDIEKGNVATTEIYVIEDGSYKKYESDYDVSDAFGSPDHIYYVNHTDENSNKNPTEIIYTPDYDQKIAWAEENELMKNNIDYIINKTKDTLNYNIIDNMGDEEMNRLSIEAALSNSPHFIAAPILDSIGPKFIKIRANESITNLTNNAIMAVISTIEEALDYRKTKYKIVFKDTNEAVFTNKEHSLKSNTPYFIWLENSLGMQISKPISVKTIDGFIQYESEIQNYFCKEFIEMFKKEYPSYKTSSALSFILDKNYNALENNKSNVFINILSDMSTNINTFGDLYNMLFSLGKTYMNYNYNVYSQFFESNVKFINTDLNYIMPSKDCYVHYVNFYPNNIEYDVLYVQKNQSFTINNNSNYTMAYFTNGTLNSVSGMILIDNILKQYKCYNIYVEVDSNGFTK